MELNSSAPPVAVTAAGLSFLALPFPRFGWILPALEGGKWWRVVLIAILVLQQKFEEHFKILATRGLFIVCGDDPFLYRLWRRA